MATFKTQVQKICFSVKRKHVVKVESEPDFKIEVTIDTNILEIMIK